jgi:putative cardiolipin synthase
MHRLKWLGGIAVTLILLTACAGPGLRDEIARPEPSFAEPPATAGILAENAARLADEDGPVSGFRLLDGSREALEWRLALIDSATSSIDLITYLWYPDSSGRLMLERVVLAAQRGVHVRLVIDDLLTIGQDQLLANLHSLPNIEVRLFNPWSKRSLGSRAAEMIAEMERLNTRMHVKLLVADGRAAIVGGRNIGDHYFGLSDAYNFHDLDVLGIGPIGVEASEMFDHYWNSDWIVSADNLVTQPDAEKAAEQWQALQEATRTDPQLAELPREPRDWSADFAAIRPELRPGRGYLVFDDVSAKDVSQTMIARMFGFFNQAQSELLITNAYIIPGQQGIDFVAALSERGVDVRILTNSLASHDVPAVNSHYEGWRDDLINAGVELFEFRADAAIQPIIDIPPASGEFTGLHTKAAVVDLRYSFVGSMNLDPRSANINTEMGAVIDSPELAADLRALMLRDMSSENAWAVTLDANGKLWWRNSDETVDDQPSRGFMTDVMNVIFKIFPKDQY